MNNKYLADTLESMLRNICSDNDYIRGIMTLLSQDKHKKKMISFINNSKNNLTPDEISYYALILDKENGPSDEYVE